MHIGLLNALVTPGIIVIKGCDRLASYDVASMLAAYPEVFVEASGTVNLKDEKAVHVAEDLVGNLYKFSSAEQLTSIYSRGLAYEVTAIYVIPGYLLTRVKSDFDDFEHIPDLSKLKTALVA